ncbi:hypothetical protein [Pseudomonas phage PhL_UNISO_PA-DSM_ph0034]|uniref:Uncharacterized protein n=1 Tax=Pseudomonas phage PhL_UNISO_PA-DSM_ph0034 TaxID=2812900 RepID=A0A9E6Q6R1_9CAUD|nr:hypothetical protein QE329_gp106 [Pseudomonas phage PhL_UNISO_PA-DSM_ph0034]QYC95226.1 hypothetical protein [Pseudomonas phage PhL_UNISO_PA-DSM_ph0034]
MEQVGLLILVCIVVGVVCLLFYSVIGMFVWESLRPLLGWMGESTERRKKEARAVLAGIFWPIAVPFMAMLFLVSLPRKVWRLTRVAITGEED